MNENETLDTLYIRDEIAKCESPDELKENIFPLLHTLQENWENKINEMLKEGHFTKVKFADLCGLSRQTVDKWCKGSMPKNRETLMRIGLAAGYNVERMNQLLQRYGRYPALYSKSLEDCVCIYVINHDYGEDAVKKYEYILEAIKKQIVRDESAEETENISTVKFDSKLSEVEDEKELDQFITDNIAMFSNAYHKLYAYVKAYMGKEYMDKFLVVESIHAMAETQGWSSSLRQCVSEIRQNKWYPTRRKIIVLGLYLSMDIDEVDQMLVLAHMEPLCAKNIIESVIMYVLEDASINGMLDRDSEYFYPSDLVYSARDILRELDLPEAADWIADLPEEYDE